MSFPVFQLDGDDCLDQPMQTNTALVRETDFDSLMLDTEGLVSLSNGFKQLDIQQESREGQSPANAQYLHELDDYARAIPHHHESANECDYEECQQQRIDTPQQDRQSPEESDTQDRPQQQQYRGFCLAPQPQHPHPFNHMLFAAHLLHQDQLLRQQQGQSDDEMQHDDMCLGDVNTNIFNFIDHSFIDMQEQQADASAAATGSADPADLVGPSHSRFATRRVRFNGEWVSQYVPQPQRVSTGYSYLDRQVYGPYVTPHAPLSAPDEERWNWIH